MRYILIGFTEDIGFRVYEFQGIDEDRKRTPYMVRADLALARRYGIHLQELPLLCRGLLEMQHADETRILTLSEVQMCDYASDCATERNTAAYKKSPRRKAPVNNIGVAWRLRESS